MIPHFADELHSNLQVVVGIHHMKSVQPKKLFLEEQIFNQTINRYGTAQLTF